MNTEVILHKANRTVNFRRQQSAGRKRTASIKDALNLFLKKVAGPAVKNVSVPDAFEQIIGPNLALNCQIDSITAGIMKVKTKPGPPFFELRSAAGQIIQQLNQHCPSANIRQIKLVCSE